MRAGGRHKDKKNKVERKQVARQEPTGGVSQETSERDEDKMIQLLDEDRMKAWVEFWSKENDDEVEQKMENWMSAFQERIELDNERANIWKCGMRWAVETRRKERNAQQGQSTGQDQSKQDKLVRFGEEEQYEKVQAQNTVKQDVMSGLEESRTSRGSTSLILGRDERSQANEIRGKGKGKGNGGKGEHGSKGKVGSKGAQQVENLVMDEEQEEHGGLVVPNMRAGGSHPQTTLASEEEGEEKRAAKCESKGKENTTNGEKRYSEEEGEIRRVRWADCEDDEEKEEEEQEKKRERQQETKEKKEQKKEKETRPETGHKEMTSEKPPGLEQWAKSEHEEEDEEERRVQEAREEERGAQEVHEEQEKEAKKAQEEREKQVKAQEERERQAKEAKAHEEQEWQVRETEAREEQREQERKIEAQGRARRRRRRNNAKRER